MGKVFINPNYHVILIHYPLGLLALGMLIELFSFLYRGSTLRLAGRWMLLLGALATIPTVYSGIYALNDIASRSQSNGAPPANEVWKKVAAGAELRGDGMRDTPIDLVAARHEPDASARRWKMLSRHVWVQSFASGLLALTAVLALGCSDHWRRRLYLPFLLLLLGGVGLMGWGAWYGGEVVYRYGAATRLESGAAQLDTTLVVAGAAHQGIQQPPLDLPTTRPTPTVVAARISPPDVVPMPAFHLSPILALSPTSEPVTQPSAPGTQPATTPTTEDTIRLPGAATAPTARSEPGAAQVEELPPASAPTTEAVVPTTAATLPASAPAATQDRTGPETLPATVPATLTAIVPPVETAPSVAATEALPATIASTLPAIESIVRSETRPSTEPATVTHTPRSLEGGADDETKVGSAAYFVGPPLQWHVIMAGVAVAISLGAFGASLRRLSLMPGAQPAASGGTTTASASDPQTQAVDEALAATYAPGRRPTTEKDIDLVRTINPGLTIVPDDPRLAAQRIPAARIWLLAFIAALLTSLIGIYFLASHLREPSGPRLELNAQVLWRAVADKDQNRDGPLTRRLAHVIAGSAIILLPLILAMLARWSRSRLMLWLVSLLLATAVAAQVWFGVLLLYDTNVGKITGMNPYSETTASAQPPG